MLRKFHWWRSGVLGEVEFVCSSVQVWAQAVLPIKFDRISYLFWETQKARKRSTNSTVLESQVENYKTFVSRTVKRWRHLTQTPTYRGIWPQHYFHFSASPPIHLTPRGNSSGLLCCSFILATAFLKFLPVFHQLGCVYLHELWPSPTTPKLDNLCHLSVASPTQMRHLLSSASQPSWTHKWQSPFDFCLRTTSSKKHFLYLKQSERIAIDPGFLVFLSPGLFGRGFATRWSTQLRT